MSAVHDDREIVTHGPSLEAAIATGMQVALMQIATAIVAPMQVGAIANWKGNASVLMQIAHS